LHPYSIRRPRPALATWAWNSSNSLCASNLHVGGEAQPALVDATDMAIIDRLAPKLRADGLFFVGLDVVGGKLTEINVTSPTGVQELDRFTGSKPAARLVEWMECRAALLKT
jgi:glutathione synthase